MTHHDVNDRLSVPVRPHRLAGAIVGVLLAMGGLATNAIRVSDVYADTTRDGTTPPPPQSPDEAAGRDGTTPPPPQMPYAVPSVDPSSEAEASDENAMASVSTASMAHRNQPFGFIVGGSPWMSRDELNRIYGMMKSAGATWVRLDVPWASIEEVRGTYHWERMDTLVHAARDNGLEVLGTIAYSPVWASSLGSGIAPPDDPNEFARFARDVAQRYGPAGVRNWQIWNEPNNFRFYKPRPDVVRYTRMLQAASAAIHDVQPDAIVMNGGLEPAFTQADGSEISGEDFLKGMLEAGAASALQAVATHPYSYPELPTQRGTESWNNFLRITNLRAIMREHGVGGLPIWGTEYGAPTGASSRAVSEDRQWQLVESGLRAWRSLSNVGPLMLYSFRDPGTDAHDNEHNFGIVRHDLSSKLSYRRLAGQ